jgi:N-methylhydantoinase B/oxoprolinase/acetone carboxylase alpha subunit
MVDPIQLEIIRGAIRAAQAEMDALLERTAISAFIREKKDFYTALFDADGVMVVGSMVPIFGDITGPVFTRFAPDSMQESDLYWYSDCYASRGAVSHSKIRCFWPRYSIMGDVPHSLWAGRIFLTSVVCGPDRSARMRPTFFRKASSSRLSS